MNEFMDESLHEIPNAFTSSTVYYVQFMKWKDLEFRDCGRIGSWMTLWMNWFMKFQILSLHQLFIMYNWWSERVWNLMIVDELVHEWLYGWIDSSNSKSFHFINCSLCTIDEVKGFGISWLWMNPFLHSWRGELGGRQGHMAEYSCWKPWLV